ncbi:MAG: hypothetical protein HQL72_15235 [Magnetococcales bacterium]|nr:hypothetical protein [Magnetococcales bacterium]
MTDNQTQPSPPNQPSESRRVTPENYERVWTYILGEIESERWTFADWPLESLQEIPLTPDPEGRAFNDLNEWIDRHLKQDTQNTMYEDIDRQSVFESKKGATEIFLSEKTRDKLLHYRSQVFGEGKGSMEMAIRQLLIGAERALPLESFQRLTVFQKRNAFSTPEEALNQLIEQAEQPVEAPTEGLSSSEGQAIKEEIQQLLATLKADTAEKPAP